MPPKTNDLELKDMSIETGKAGRRFLAVNFDAIQKILETEKASEIAKEIALENAGAVDVIEMALEAVSELHRKDKPIPQEVIDFLDMVLDDSND